MSLEGELERAIMERQSYRAELWLVMSLCIGSCSIDLHLTTVLYAVYIIFFALNIYETVHESTGGEGPSRYGSAPQ